MLPRVFSRGQAIRVGLTFIGIRATATPTQQKGERMPRGDARELQESGGGL